MELTGLLPPERPLPDASEPDPNFKPARAFMTDEERERYDRTGEWRKDDNDQD